MIAMTKGEAKFQLDQTIVQQHITKMCETPPRPTNYVHCKLKIFSHILHSHEEGFLDSEFQNYAVKAVFIAFRPSTTSWGRDSKPKVPIRDSITHGGFRTYREPMP